jgi:hypothetical protein
MDGIEAFVKDTCAQLWIQHGKEQSATIKHSPHKDHNGHKKQYLFRIKSHLS